MIAQTVTYPLHIVRRRLQVGGVSKNPASPAGTPGCKPMYSSVSQGLLRIYQTEGLRNGLFKGVTLTWLKGPLASALGFTANDIFQNIIHDARAELSNSPHANTGDVRREKTNIEFRSAHRRRHGWSVRENNHSAFRSRQNHVPSRSKQKVYSKQCV